MNKRILELAKEAEILEWEVLPWNKDARTPNHESAAKAAKFAELIVQECARVARNTNLEDVEGGDSDVLYAASEQIKQHFGVE